MSFLNIFPKKLKKKEEKVAPEIKKKEEKPEIVKREVKKETKKDTGEAYRVLIKPLITEKVSFLGQYNQYVFEVSPNANKIQIAKAIENVYGVRPKSVNVLPIKGKEVRYGRTVGKTKERKKAVITLRPGEKIEVYEGV
jgi:large subunit ribosomal protein L23